MRTVYEALDVLRSDVAVGLLMLVVLLSWPGEIIGFVCDLLGVK